MEPEGSLLHSQAHATLRILSQISAVLDPPSYFLKIHF